MPKLPTPPSMIDHASKLPSNVGMMGNDTYGDCTVAAAGHMVQSWTTYAERGTLTIPDSDILKAYFTVSPNDDGAYALDVLNLWRKTGIGVDKIEGFVEVDVTDLNQIKLAIQYFGSCYVGMSLPDINTFGPWTTVTGPPNPYNGHMINYCAYDDVKKEFTAITWGEKVPVSYAWSQKYADEGYAVLNDISLIQASGKTPENFDWATLQYDLTHIGDPITPPAPVPPVPVPSVSSIAITIVDNPNYVVSMDGVAQTPTHYSPMEATEHAVNLKFKNPKSVINVFNYGRWVVTTK